MRARDPASCGRRRYGLLTTTLLLGLAACQDSPTDPVGNTSLEAESNRPSETTPYHPGWLMGSGSMTEETDEVRGYLLTVDTATGVAEKVADLPRPGISLAFSVFWGELFGALKDTAGSTLTRIDPRTGALAVVGAIRDRHDWTHLYRVNGMDFIGRRLYGVTLDGFFVRINHNTARATVVGMVGVDLCHGCYGAATTREGAFYLFAHSDTLVGMTLFTIDAATGQATRIRDYAFHPEAVSLAITHDGRFFAGLDESLYRLEPGSWNLEAVGETGFPRLAGLAFIDELALACPCGAEWRNHGKYEVCVVHATDAWKAAGILTGSQAAALRVEAARSTCGRHPQPAV